MGVIFAIIMLVATMLLGKWFLDCDDDDHDEWRGW